MFTCIVCKNTFKGGRTRKYCKECNKIPRYCACGCGIQLTYPYHDSKFTSGHNVYCEPKELIRARGLKGKIASMKTEKTQEFTCRLCDKLTQGVNGRKTCIECQTKSGECACGCGTKIKNNSRGYGRPVNYRTGHYTRTLSFEEQKRRNRKRLAKRSYTEEHNKANSERMKQLYKDGKLIHLFEYDGKTSKVERSLKPYVEPLGYVHTLDKRYFIGKSTDRVRIPDYVNSKERKIIEVWGRYWHRGQDPQEMIDWYTSYGWSCIALWEDEVSEFIDSLSLERASN